MEVVGETQLMGDIEEGSEEDRRRGNMRQKHKKMDKARRDGDGPKPKYTKPKAPKKVEESRRPATGSRKRVDEAWLSAIPNVGNPRKTADNSDMSEDDIEMMELRRLAGMNGVNRRLF